MTEGSDDPADIVQRLENLSKWQEEQKRMLFERQSNQRKLLGMEHKKMCELLGIYHSPADKSVLETKKSPKKGTALHNNSLGLAVLDQSEGDENEQGKESTTPAEHGTEGKSKRIFLRRKQGLINRFKMDPDQFRLNKLPKYRFRSVHPVVRKRLPKRTKEPTKDSKKEISPKAAKGVLSLKANEGEFLKNPHMDKMEKKFHEALKSSKNFCNSTPDPKSQQSSVNELPELVSWAAILNPQNIKPIETAIASTVRQESLEESDTLTIFQLLEQQAQNGSVDLNSSGLKEFVKKAQKQFAIEKEPRVAVSKNLQPVPQEIYKNTKFSSASSESDSEAEEIPKVTSKVRFSTIETTVETTSHTLDSIDGTQHFEEFKKQFFANLNDTNQSGVDEKRFALIKELQALNPTLVTQIFEEFEKQMLANQNDTVPASENEKTTELQEKTQDSSGVKNQIFAGQSDSTLTNDVEKISTQAEQPHEQTQDSSESSQLFEKFKKHIFGNHNFAALIEDYEKRAALTKELQEKAEQVKARLQELEAEIATFKQNNLDLTKSKRQHELEKAHFDQERQEALEKLEDERLQIEIYLHDERMKIEDDRKKIETQIRLQKAASLNKDKKEIAKLREQIDTLQKELKKKDETHFAVQARLRSHVRNLEKDIRQLNEEIEVLTKENKRLESEKLIFSRQHSTKMLKEINRNICKLALKATDQTTPAPPVSTHSIPALKENKVIPQPHRQSAADVRKKSNTVKPLTPSSISSECSNDESSNETIEQEITETEKESEADEPPKPQSSSAFKREIRNPDGSIDVLYPNGNLKKISSDGMIIRMLYFNKDIKETNINDGTVKYYYAETNTWHTTYLDGLEILEFPNGQTEHRHKDGRIEVHFPNNTIKVSDPSDDARQEEWRFADGSNLIQMRNGDRILLMPNGQKEIHTSLSKRREYPDGTVKLVYPDGSQETRYSNGRVRLKDKDGNLLMDTDGVKY